MESHQALTCLSDLWQSLFLCFCASDALYWKMCACQMRLRYYDFATCPTKQASIHSLSCDGRVQVRRQYLSNCRVDPLPRNNYPSNSHGVSWCSAGQRVRAGRLNILSLLRSIPFDLVCTLFQSVDPNFDQYHDGCRHEG